MSLHGAKHVGRTRQRSRRVCPRAAVGGPRNGRAWFLGDPPQLIGAAPGSVGRPDHRAEPSPGGQDSRSASERLRSDFHIDAASLASAAETGSTASLYESSNAQEPQQRRGVEEIHSERSATAARLRSAMSSLTRSAGKYHHRLSGGIHEVVSAPHVAGIVALPHVHSQRAAVSASRKSVMLRRSPAASRSCARWWSRGEP